MNPSDLLFLRSHVYHGPTCVFCWLRKKHFVEGWKKKRPMETRKRPSVRDFERMKRNKGCWQGTIQFNVQLGTWNLEYSSATGWKLNLVYDVTVLVQSAVLVKTKQIVVFWPIVTKAWGLVRSTHPFQSWAWERHGNSNAKKNRNLNIVGVSSASRFNYQTKGRIKDTNGKALEPEDSSNAVVISFVGVVGRSGEAKREDVTGARWVLRSAESFSEAISIPKTDLQYRYNSRYYSTVSTRYYLRHWDHYAKSFCTEKTYSRSTNGRK